MTQNNDNLSRAGMLAGRLPGLLLEAERVAHSFMKGIHGRRQVGTGEAFWQFRPWQQGDASRDIDWRQTGKREEIFVRQTEWEAAQTVWLYRDASESMNYHAKKDYAEILLLALGIVLLNGGERVGLLGTNLLPQTGYAAVQRIYESLSAQTHLVESGHTVAAKSSVILISDFYFPIEQLSTFCEKLASRDVTGMLVQLFSSDEQTLPYRGRVRFQDVEDRASEPLLVQEVEAIRSAYEQKFTAHQENLAALSRGLGWKFIKLSTETQPEVAITKLYNSLSSQK
ncbi:MAG: DUF58 domain-containing protein [Proteobacteria bacterium]|nr:DUF58 domain-containing protein [Pseudomonadota bacterium]